MNLAEAIYYGPYTGAVVCLSHWRGGPAYAHVCRQGGQDVPVWWSASVTNIILNVANWNGVVDGSWSCDILHENIMSFGTIDGCYDWLEKHSVDTNEGWYPTRAHQKWYQLGEEQL